MSAIDFASARVSTLERDAGLQLWVKRATAARNHRRRFEKVWMESGLFAAGQQWVEYNTRTHRALVPDPQTGRKKRSHDVLMQYVWTVMGAVAADDFRPLMVAGQDGQESEDAADYVNKALAYAWEREFDGDEVVHDLLLDLVIYGTAAIRCRYDRSAGPLISEQMPYREGEPILDPAERTRVMGESYSENGVVSPVQMGALREGKIVWESLSPWNLLPQPGIARERDLSWEIVVRPVPIDDLRERFPEQAGALRPESIESMDVLGTPKQDDRGGQTGEELEEHVLVYTGYERPGPRNPNGECVVFTRKTMLGQPVKQLPYDDKNGIVYFRWWPVNKRFWGRGFIEPGMEPQRTLNKRETQVDEIIDRSMPKVLMTRRTARKMKVPKGLVMEVVELPDGSDPPQIENGPGPGTWMDNELARLPDAVADALGVKRVALGENPPGIGNYSQYVAVKEQEAVKLGPISQRFNIGLANLAMVTVPAMKRWPDSKKLLIVGEEDQLEVLRWNKSKVPDDFLFRPAKRGSQPRGVGAELAKVNDLWAAALATQVVMRNPIPWLDWYQQSQEAGKVQPLPDDGFAEQQHKAALEDLVMEHQGRPVPVSPSDIAEIHIPEHDRTISQLNERALAEGDQEAALAAQAIEQHKQMHLMMAQQLAGGTGVSPPGGTPPAPAAPQPTPPA